MKYSFIVTVDLKETEDPGRIASHVCSAVFMWGGQYDPDDSLFPTNMRRVDVRGRGLHLYDGDEDEG